MADAHSRPRPKHFRDLTGQRFGRLTATGHRVVNRRTIWSCSCDCGQTREVLSHNLIKGATRSCGCLMRESRYLSTGANFTTHGACRAPTRASYKRWRAMMDRCYIGTTAQFCDYGGRGIYVVKRWHHAPNFVADMGNPPEGMTLERIDNNGPYSPENCRWATRAEQSLNHRRNRLVTYNGETKPLIEWSKQTGIHHRTLTNRIDRGWSVERALTQPAGPANRLKHQAPRASG